MHCADLDNRPPARLTLNWNFKVRGRGGEHDGGRPTPGEGDAGSSVDSSPRSSAWSNSVSRAAISRRSISRSMNSMASEKIVTCSGTCSAKAR